MVDTRGSFFVIELGAGRRRLVHGKSSPSARVLPLLRAGVARRAPPICDSSMTDLSQHRRHAGAIVSGS